MTKQTNIQYIAAMKWNLSTAATALSFLLVALCSGGQAFVLNNMGMNNQCCRHRPAFVTPSSQQQQQQQQQHRRHELIVLAATPTGAGGAGGVSGPIQDAQLIWDNDNDSQNDVDNGKTALSLLGEIQKTLQKRLGLSPEDPDKVLPLSEAETMYLMVECDELLLELQRMMAASSAMADNNDFYGHYGDNGGSSNSNDELDVMFGGSGIIVDTLEIDDGGDDAMADLFDF